MTLLFTISHFILIFALGFYLISSLQWFNYKFERIIFNYTKPLWHFYFFIIPIAIYYLPYKELFLGYEYLILLPQLYFWHKKLDKKLVFTSRVKRFFLFLFIITIFYDLVCLIINLNLGVLIPLMLAFLISFVYEKIEFIGYKNEALKKLREMENLKIITITASYGKTSIKNILFHILNDNFKTYKTPRSVNTLAGLIKDINNDLPNDSEIYIAEAGARISGDILEISKFLNHHYAIVGKIGTQHIEYFKSIENIRNTKMEIIKSKNLIKAFVHKSAYINPYDNIEKFGDEILNIKSSLDGISFDLIINQEVHHFVSPLLGDFNAINITAAIKVALELGMSVHEISQKVSSLKPTEHRLQKINAGGKIIIDDSFNGNYEGMISSYNLANSYKGRKVIVTPGIVESTKEANISLSQNIDLIFDLVIITGQLNSEILNTNIIRAKKILLKDKSTLQNTLAKETQVGDLILFSNDTPSFM